MTINMEMAGMKMPARTTKTCMPKGAEAQPDKGAGPGPNDPSCQMYDQSASGNTSRFKMRCTGKMAMESATEITRTADTMNMVTTTTMGNRTMKNVTVSKRIGTCDAGAERKKATEQAETMHANSCTQALDSAVKYVDSATKIPRTWTDPKECGSSKATLCEKARAFVNNGSYAEYNTYQKQSKSWMIAECGIKLEVRRLELCKKAATDKNNEFLRTNCPEQVQIYVEDFAKNCKGFGRDYTADLARPNAKQCMALRAWAPKGAKGTAR
jgi:hypothetical protein